MAIGMESSPESRQEQQKEILKTELESAQRELGAILDDCIEKTAGGTYVVKEGMGEKLMHNKIEILGKLSNIKDLREGNPSQLEPEMAEMVLKLQTAVDYLRAESEI